MDHIWITIGDSLYDLRDPNARYAAVWKYVETIYDTVPKIHPFPDADSESLQIFIQNIFALEMVKNTDGLWAFLMTFADNPHHHNVRSVYRIYRALESSHILEEIVRTRLQENCLTLLDEPLILAMIKQADHKLFPSHHVMVPEIIRFMRLWNKSHFTFAIDHGTSVPNNFARGLSQHDHVRCKKDRSENRIEVGKTHQTQYALAEVSKHR